MEAQGLHRPLRVTEVTPHGPVAMRMHRNVCVEAPSHTVAGL